MQIDQSLQLQFDTNCFLLLIAPEQTLTMMRSYLSGFAAMRAISVGWRRLWHPIKDLSVLVLSHSSFQEHIKSMHIHTSHDAPMRSPRLLVCCLKHLHFCLTDVVGKRFGFAHDRLKQGECLLLHDVDFYMNLQSYAERRCRMSSDGAKCSFTTNALLATATVRLHAGVKKHRAIYTLRPGWIPLNLTKDVRFINQINDRYSHFLSRTVRGLNSSLSADSYTGVD